MKKTKIRRMLAIGLVLTCMGISSLQAFAYVELPSDNIVISPRYIAIIDTETLLEKTGSTLSCYGYTNVQVGYSSKTVVELQRYSSNAWTTIKTWTSTGTTSSEVDKTYTATSGTYRLKITHSAYNSNGVLIESTVTYSNIV